MKVFVEIYNARKLRNKFAQLGKNKRKIINTEARAAAKPLLAATKAAAPSSSGLTKKNIKLKAIRKSRVRFGVNVAIRQADWKEAKVSKRTRKKSSNRFKPPKKFKIFYASFVEFGTEKIEARHWMERVAKRMGRQVRRDFMKRMLKRIKQIAGRPTQLNLFDKFK